MTPVPGNVERLHAEAIQMTAAVEPLLREGDIVFRLSNTQLLGGLIDFSKEVAKATESSFSHAVIVYRVTDDGVILADITNTGIARRYFIDWYMDGTENLAVKRLKPEYASALPLVMYQLRQYMSADVLYDPKFVALDDNYYCTELVDACFRNASCPLADRVAIRDWPKFNMLVRAGCLAGGIDTRTQVAIAGNEKTGLFSSDKLFTVLDTRK